MSDTREAVLERIVSNLKNYCDNAQPCEDPGCLWQSHFETMLKQEAVPVSQRIIEKFEENKNFKGMVRQLYSSVRNKAIPLQDLKDAMEMVVNEIEYDGNLIR